MPTGARVQVFVMWIEPSATWAVLSEGVTQRRHFLAVFYWFLRDRRSFL